MDAPFFQAAVAALLNASVAWIIGVLCARIWLRNAATEWQAKAIARILPAMTIGLVVCVAGSVFSLWVTAAMMGDLPILDAWPAVGPMLTSTHYGYAGAAGIAALLLAATMHTFLHQAHPSGRYIGAMVAAIVLFAFTRALAGHAVEYGVFSLAVAAEWMHILLMGSWVGMVTVCGWLVLPWAGVESGLDRLATRSILMTMSRWATFTLAGIIVTGAWNSYRVLGSWRDLDHGYGLVLIVKLCLVALAIALGGYNRLVNLRTILSPDLKNGFGLQHVARVVFILRLESIVLFLVLIAAAVLAGSAPPTPP